MGIEFTFVFLVFELPRALDSCTPLPNRVPISLLTYPHYRCVRRKDGMKTDIDGRDTMVLSETRPCT